MLPRNVLAEQNPVSVAGPDSVDAGLDLPVVRLGIASPGRNQPELEFEDVPVGRPEKATRSRPATIRGCVLLSKARI
jgi:hypothetical protein